MNRFINSPVYFCFALLLSTSVLTGCGSATTEPAWETYANEAYGYEFDHPGEVRVEEATHDASQVKVHAGTGDPFLVTAAREYSPAEAALYLDTASVGEREIGGNLWSEFLLPDGYCDAARCSPPLYALRMGSGDVLYTVTFTSQDSTTELQERILSTFRVSGTP